MSIGFRLQTETRKPEPENRNQIPEKKILNPKPKPDSWKKNLNPKPETETGTRKPETGTDSWKNNLNPKQETGTQNNEDLHKIHPKIEK